MTLRTVRDETMPQGVARTLLIGDDTPAEMRGVVRELRRLTADGFRRSDDIDAARQIIVDEGCHPDLIVALESWPDESSSADVLELISLAPLARFVCVYGAWCDSAGRTRSAWPLAARVSTECAPERIARELALIRGERALPACAVGGLTATTNPLPLTASRGEIFAADFSARRATKATRGVFGVDSPDPWFRGMLEAALRGDGPAVTSLHGSASPAAIVFDADPWTAARAMEMNAMRSRWPETPLVVAAGFPRPDLIDQWHAAGADAVWFKLAPIRALESILVEGRVD